MPPDPMTSAALRRLHEAATEGPWEYREFEGDEPRGIVAEPSGDPVVIEAGMHYETDLRLIAALRNAAPRLIALLEAAERAEATPNECTGLSASWCPKCGDCSCPRNQGGERQKQASRCPLHGDKSRHADDNNPQRGGG